MANRLSALLTHDSRPESEKSWAHWAHHKHTANPTYELGIMGGQRESLRWNRRALLWASAAGESTPARCVGRGV